MFHKQIIYQKKKKKEKETEKTLKDPLVRKSKMSLFNTSGHVLDSEIHRGTYNFPNYQRNIHQTVLMACK